MKNLVYLLLGVAVWPCAAPAQTFPVGAGGQDSYIDSRNYGPSGDRRDDNYGTETRMKIGHTDNSNTNYTIGLVQFDLTGTPSTNVSRVWVSLAIDPATPAAGSPAMVTVHGLTEAWGEGTVTWNNQPSADGEVIGSAMVENVQGARFQWDITPLYLGWKAGSIPNHGVQFVTWENNGEGFSFVSSENTANPELRPQMIVETEGLSTSAVAGDFVLHELTDAFSGFDFAGRPGTDTHVLMESSQLGISGGVVNETITGGYAVRMVSEQTQFLPDKAVSLTVNTVADSVNETLVGTSVSTPGGELWAFFDEEALSYQVSGDGNYLLHHGNERTGQWRSLGVGFGVKKGSGLTAASVTGDWFVAEAGRTFGLPRTWPAPDPNYQWKSMEGVLCSAFSANYDGTNGFSITGTETVLERTIGDHQVMVGSEPNVDNQFWTEFLLDTYADADPWGGTYVVSGDGTLTQTVDDDGEIETIEWNVSPDGDVMVSGLWDVEGIWVEALMGVAVRKPTAMVAADVVGDWAMSGLEPSIHPPADPLNRQVFAYRSWFTFRADGTYVERIEDYSLSQMLGNEAVSEGSPAESVIRNRAGLVVAGPVEEYIEGTWAVSSTGELTLSFMEEGEAESMTFHVAANGQVAVLSESWIETDSVGCEFVVGVRMPAVEASALSEPQVVTGDGGPAVQLPITGGHPKRPVRIMTIEPDGSSAEYGNGGVGGSVIIGPDEIAAHPTRLFKVE